MRNLRFLYGLLLLGLLWSCSPVKKLSSLDNPTEAEDRKMTLFLSQAASLKAQGKIDDAFEMYLHCLDIQPESAVVYYELSRYYQALRKDSTAQAMLEKAIRLEPSSYWYQIELLGFYRNRAMTDQAIPLAIEMTRQYPDKTELFYLLAELYASKEEYALAIKVVNEIESQMGISEEISLAKFKFYKQLDQSDKAYQELKTLIRKYPAQMRYQILLGDIYLSDENPDKALDIYQKVIEQEPQNGPVRISLALYYLSQEDTLSAQKEIVSALRNKEVPFENKISIASRLLLGNRTESQSNSLFSAENIFGLLIDEYPFESDVYLFYAQYLASEQKYKEALVRMHTAVDLSPNNLDLWMQMVALSLSDSNFKELHSICEKGLIHFPENPDFYYYNATALMVDKQYHKVIATLQKGLPFVPSDKNDLLSNYYGQLGDAYQQIKEKQKTIEAYEKALVYNPKNYLVKNNYSYFIALDSKGDYPRAEKMSGECVAAFPNNDTYLDTYAWIYFKLGNYFLAKFYIERALANCKEPNHEIYEHYGDILFMNKEAEKALEYWKKAAEVGGNSSLLTQKINQKKYVEQ